MIRRKERSANRYSRCEIHMFNKKMTAGKTVFLIFIAIIIFALSMVFPALQAAKSVIYADTDALVDSVNLPDVELHLKIIMRDNLRNADIVISETDSISDIVYKSTTIPGLTSEAVKLIYEESGIKWFLKNKLKLIQKVITERDGTQRSIILLTPSEIVELLKDNAEIIKKHTGYTLEEKDYESVERFFKDNDKISTYMNSATLQSKTYVLGDTKTNIVLASVIAGILIAVFVITGLLVTKNLTSAFVSAGVPLFFAGFISLVAGVTCRTAVFLSKIDPSNFLRFLADTLTSPFLVCGAILIGVSMLCFVMALVSAKIICAEKTDDGEKDDGSFSYEYFTGSNGAQDKGSASGDYLPVPSDVAEEAKNKEAAEGSGTGSEDNAGSGADENDGDDDEWKRYWIDPSDDDTDQ